MFILKNSDSIEIERIESNKFSLSPPPHPQGKLQLQYDTLYSSGLFSMHVLMHVCIFFVLQQTVIFSRETSILFAFCYSSHSITSTGSLNA